MPTDSADGPGEKPRSGVGGVVRSVWASFETGPLRLPFVSLYLVVSWIIFLAYAEPGTWIYETPAEDLRRWLYWIPDLVENTPAALLAMVTAPWVHRTAIQLAFVTFGLLLFGTRLELREGTLRTVAIFYGSTTIAAILAGAALHIIYPSIIDTRALDIAWTRSWGGGSAGVFGVIGALIGRARNPWPLIGLVVAWETAFALFVYRDYVPAFHAPAFFVGFAATRWLLPGSRDETARSLLTGARWGDRS
jgi:membrane associated rhomboid family serine protease